VARPYFIGVHEVTNDQWRKVMGNSPSSRQEGQLPVESVKWVEVVEFCRELSQLPDERSRGLAYRLPTEAEWELACRAGSTTSYSFGDDDKLLDGFGWCRLNSLQNRTEGEGVLGDIARSAVVAWTAPVGIKMPNAWGLYDMHGNVREVCSDLYGPYSRDARVTRGGAWLDEAAECQSSARGCHDVSNPLDGFRVAVSLFGAEPTTEQPVPASKDN
jgi:formylglycine-generating enzyme required for sulfatase activity